MDELIDCRAEHPIACGFDKDGESQTKFIDCETSGFDCTEDGDFTGEWTKWKNFVKRLRKVEILASNVLVKLITNCLCNNSRTAKREPQLNIHWGAWLKFESGSKWHCPTECYSKKVMAYRKRMCIRNEPKDKYTCEGVLKEDTRLRQERWISSDPFTDRLMAQFRSCMQEVNVEGKLQNLPRCRKEWTVWTAWTACPKNINDNCKTIISWQSIQSVRIRKCIGFGRYCLPKLKKTIKLLWNDTVKQLLKVEQTFPIMDVEKVNCYKLMIGKNLKHIKNQIDRCNLNKVNGKWGSWSMWSRDCDVTCGWGRRSRIRYCNNPPPIAGGKECIGRSNEVRWCKANLLCPINGGWTEWTLLECNATCSPGGVLSKRRWCSNPPPMFGGFVCSGSAFVTGIACNENVDCEKALMPKLSDALENEIQKNINQTFNNIEKIVLKRHLLNCNILATKMFRNEIPSVKIYWTFNGHSLGLSAYTSLEGDSIFLTKLYPFNSGVYTCEAEYWRSKDQFQ
ncbi:DgyrCDS3702 [Dimorphilus gyrociliatus]|uniref:DgyrCDS3702 n=1 Tax=Dimorphilus gyrociliatus TaxID=2664684 RepID=A0A7I8VFA5_9ANNE|nr:DgyrCDS3702 [Dimorphilus gyrociliatus]